MSGSSCATHGKGPERDTWYATSAILVAATVARTEIKSDSFRGMSRLKGRVLGGGAEQAGGADLAGGGLSQLELDVGSLLGVGDDNSWDRPPARPAAAPAAPRTASGVGGGPRPAPTAHDPGTTLSAFHELFPASHSAGDSKNGA